MLDQEKRSEECYIIQPEIYLNQLKGQTKGDFWNEQIESINEGRVQSVSGKIFEGNTIVLAAGAYSKLNENLFIPHRAIEESSIVAGTCGFFKKVDWGKKGMVFFFKRRKSRLSGLGSYPFTREEPPTKGPHSNPIKRE